jgi:predicted RNA-binding protein with PIN domain
MAYPLAYNLLMPYLIDGHNLIPKLGLQLDSMDDEMQLIEKLREFCRIQRRQVEVFFDGAPPGNAGTRTLGAVKAHFIRIGATADAAIVSRLKRIGRSARNWTVVSSDRQVLAEARSAKAQLLTSESFAALMNQAPGEPASASSADREVSTEEVEKWLETRWNKQELWGNLLG